jgi:hypothetical protein
LRGERAPRRWLEESTPDSWLTRPAQPSRCRVDADADPLAEKRRDACQHFHEQLGHNLTEERAMRRTLPVLRSAAFPWSRNGPIPSPGPRRGCLTGELPLPVSL